MSANKGGVFLAGEVCNVDFKQGQTKTGDNYAFHIVSVFTGREVIEVRWDSTKLGGQIVKDGDRVNLTVSFSVYAGRLQCNVTGLEPVLAPAKTA